MPLRSLMECSVIDHESAAVLLLYFLSRHAEDLPGVLGLPPEAVQAGLAAAHGLVGQVAELTRQREQLIAHVQQLRTHHLALQELLSLQDEKIRALVEVLEADRCKTLALAEVA